MISLFMIVIRWLECGQQKGLSVWLHPKGRITTKESLASLGCSASWRVNAENRSSKAQYALAHERGRPEPTIRRGGIARSHHRGTPSVEGGFTQYMSNFAIGQASLRSLTQNHIGDSVQTLPRLAVVFSCVTALVGCEGNTATTLTPPSRNVASVVVKDAPSGLVVGTTARLSAVVKDADANILTRTI